MSAFLTADGQRIELGQRVAVMAALLANHQAEIDRHPEGSLELHFSKGRVVLRLHATMGEVRRREGDG